MYRVKFEIIMFKDTFYTLSNLLLMTNCQDNMVFIMLFYGRHCVYFTRGLHQTIWKYSEYSRYDHMPSRKDIWMELTEAWIVQCVEYLKCDLYSLR